MQSSTATENDLSDGEWEEVARTFHEAYAKYGGLWTSMRSKQKAKEAAAIASPIRPRIESHGAGKDPSPRLSSLANSDDSRHGDDSGERSTGASATPSPVDASWSPATSPEPRHHESERDHSLADSESPLLSPRVEYESYDDDGDDRPDRSRPEARVESPSGLDLDDDGAGGPFDDESHDPDDDDDEGIDSTEYDEFNVGFQQLQIGEESGTGPTEGGDATVTLTRNDGDDTEHQDSPRGFESLRPDGASLVAAAASPCPSNASASSSDVSGESTVVCFDHVDFDKPRRTSHVTTTDPSSFLVESADPLSCSVSPLPHEEPTGIQQTPFGSREEAPTDPVTSRSGRRRQSLSPATPFVTLRSNRRRRQRQLLVDSDRESGEGAVRVEERRTGAYFSPHGTVGGMESASPSTGSPGDSNALSTDPEAYPWASNLICQPCATAKGDDAESAAFGSHHVGTFTVDGAVQAEPSKAGQLNVLAHDLPGLDRTGARSKSLEEARSSPGDLLVANFGGRSDCKVDSGLEWSPSDNYCPSDEGFEDAPVREGERRQSIPQFISTNRSVDTIMSPMHDSAWAANATVAASYTTSSCCRADRTPITRAKPRRVPTSILRSTAETVLSPLASMTPHLRPVMQAVGHASLANGGRSSSMRSLSSGPSLKISPQTRSDERVSALAEPSVGSEGPSDDDSDDDDVPFRGANQQSQRKSKIRSRRVIFDESDEEAGDDADEPSRDASASRNDVADVSSQPFHDTAPNLGTISANELVQTMDGAHSDSPPLNNSPGSGFPHNLAETTSTMGRLGGPTRRRTSIGTAGHEVGDRRHFDRGTLPRRQRATSPQIKGNQFSFEESSDEHSDFTLRTGTDSMSSKESRDSTSRVSRKGGKLAVGSDVVDMASPVASIACQSPRFIDLVNSSSDSGDSEEDQASQTQNRRQGKRSTSNLKQSEAVIDLLSSSSESEAEEEFGSEYDDSRSQRLAPVGRPTPSKRSERSSYSSDDDESGENAPQSLSSKRAFLRQRVSMAQTLFLEYDRRVFQGALSRACTLKWSKRLITTAGLTQMPNNSKSATVILSSKLIDRETRLRLTLMHELCHAASWIIDGCSKPPHGKVFRKWGARAERLIPDMTVSTTHNYEIHFKYSWTCQNADCGRVYGRTRRTIDVARHRCGECKNQLAETVKPGTAKPKAPPSEYQRFVQENSASVRRQLEAAASNVLLSSGSSGNQPAVASAKKVSQSDVMKECARLWQARKASSTPARENDTTGHSGERAPETSS